MAKFYLGEVKLESMRSVALPLFGMYKLRGGRGLVQGVLKSVAFHVPGIRADCCGSLQTALGLVNRCGFLLFSLTFASFSSTMPRNTRNRQAAAGAEAFPLAAASTSENPANGNNVPPVSSASSSSLPSPEFLATVVQAVKSALAAEQQAISSSEISPVFSAPFQANIAALALPSSSGGVPALHSQALALVASEAGFASSAGSSAVQVSSVQGRLPVVPSFVSTFSNLCPHRWLCLRPIWSPPDRHFLWLPFSHSQPCTSHSSLAPVFRRFRENW